MSTKRKFTPEEVELLRSNPNVLSATSSVIRYTLAFKQAYIRESTEQGMTSIKFFEKSGLGVELLGKSRVLNAAKSLKKEAASPQGLREAKGKSREERMDAFAKEELEKKQTTVAIREMQERIVHLEQQIEFLKKTRFPR